MPSIKKTRSGTFQLCVKNKLLPKTFWATFDTFEQAPPKRASWTIGRCIAEYIRNNPVPVSDVKLLDTIRPGLELFSTGNLNYDWADGWIRSMKREANLAPSTIRHRHGALARCFDWMLRKHPDVLAQNPLRLLKRGFSTYTDEDRKVLARSDREAKYASSATAAWLPRRRPPSSTCSRATSECSSFSHSRRPCACASATRWISRR
jgi:hypothetical protein